MNATATGTTTLDTNIELAEIENRLQSQLGCRVRDFKLRFDGDGIVMRGLARTYYAKQLAQHAVMRETDVPIAANEIEVY